MAVGPPPVLTARHKFAGNIVPLALFFLVAGIGLWIAYGVNQLVIGFAILAFSPILCWLTVNGIGLWDNDQLKKTMSLRLRFAHPNLNAPKYFVGFARPSYRSVLDPHEDVGFLILHEDRIEFYGGIHNIEFSREDFHEVVTRSNPHSLLGLGGWVSIEGNFEGQPIRMLIEPREDSSLLGNKGWARFLTIEIKKWAAPRSSLPGQSPGTPAKPADYPSVSRLVRQGSRLL